MGSATLPILMDRQKEIVGVACDGDVKKMCSLMILQNQSIKDVMFVGPTNDTVLGHICCLGKLKLLKCLQSMMSQKEFIDYIFLTGIYGQNCVDYAIKYSNVSIVKYLFDMKQVQEQYKNNDALIFRLSISLFGKNTSEYLTEYVLSALNINKEKVIAMLNFKCPKQPEADNDGAFKFHEMTIITRVVWSGTLKHLQRLIARIGNQTFVDNMLNVDGLHCDAMGYALMKKNKNVIEYILLIDGVKAKYMSDNDLLHGLVETINRFIDSKETLQCIVDALGLTEAKLNQLKAYRTINIDKFLPFIK